MWKFAQKIFGAREFVSVPIFCFVVLLILLDQVSKYFVYKLDTRSFGLVGISHFINTDFAFGFTGQEQIIIFVSLVILFGLMWFMLRTWPKWESGERLAWLFVLAGAVSNTVERMVNHGVRDFVQLGSGHFNFADGFILFGIGYILWAGLNLRKAKN